MSKEEKIASDHFSADVAEFIFLLNKYEVKYLLVGGEAVIFYGHARLTGDVDFFYENTASLARQSDQHQLHRQSRFDCQQTLCKQVQGSGRYQISDS